ncbi:MAG: hypothetical protein EXR51_11775 [Dehalococcoidia bacterium]|nr:hypothetical protein [Dehalococcoidia bacterium]
MAGTISNNTAFRSEGGLSNNGAATLTDTTINGNTGLGSGTGAGAGPGAGGISQGTTGTLTLNTTRLNSNIAGTTGGGIGMGGTLTMNDSTISGNVATVHGGGISMGGIITVNRSTLSGNTATNGVGGGIAMAGGSMLTVTNSTMSGNTAALNGGGISNFGATVTLANSTLNGNSSTGGLGGGLYTASGTSSLKNTVVANSTAGGNCGGVTLVTSQGHNLSGDASCLFGGAGDLNNMNPNLGPLQNNGGPTFTHALLPGSPAIDAGDNTGCPATDQRAVARPVDGNGDSSAVCDIGAFEFVPAPPPPDPFAGFHAHHACRQQEAGNLRDTGVDGTAPAPGCPSGWQALQILVKH